MTEPPDEQEWLVPPFRPDEDAPGDTYIPSDWSGVPTLGFVEFIAAEMSMSVAAAELVAPKIADRVAYERTTGLARRFVRDEQLARDADFAGIDVITGAALLTRERPPRPRVFGDLVLDGHNVTVVARYKTGKSTLSENMVWSATSGRDFLGRYPVTRPMRVAYLNYELDERDMDLRLRRLMLSPDELERVLVINLRGRRLPLMTAAGRRWLCERLVDHGTQLLIIDPFGAAYASAGGESENDNAEVRRFTTALDEIKRTAGIGTLVVPVHTGRATQEEGEEAARGATVVDDWPDVQMFLTKDKQEQRFLRTDGRAPFRLHESRLGFDESTGRLMLATSDLGVSRSRARTEERHAVLMTILKEQPGLNKRALRDAMGAGGVKGNEDKDQAIDTALANRDAHFHPGPGVSKLHYRGESHGTDEDCPEGWKP
jgi:hypothetical protein